MGKEALLGAGVKTVRPHWGRVHHAAPKVGTWELLFARKTTDNGLTKYGEAETKEQLANIEEEIHEDDEASLSEGRG